MECPENFYVQSGSQKLFLCSERLFLRSVEIFSYATVIMRYHPLVEIKVATITNGFSLNNVRKHLGE